MYVINSFRSWGLSRWLGAKFDTSKRGHMEMSTSFVIKVQIIDKILTEIKRLYSMQNNRDLIAIEFCHAKELKNINISIPQRGRLTGLFFFFLDFHFTFY